MTTSKICVTAIRRLSIFACLIVPTLAYAAPRNAAFVRNTEQIIEVAGRTQVTVRPQFRRPMPIQNGQFPNQNPFQNPNQNPFQNPNIPNQNPNSSPFQNPNFPNQSPFQNPNSNPFQNPNFPNQNPLYPQTPVINPQNPISSQGISLGVFGKFVNQGMLIHKVVAGSPAAKAGVLVGDLIVKVDNQVIRNTQQLQQVLQTSGGTVNLLVRRQNGQVQQLVAQVGFGGSPIAAPYVLGVTGTFTVQGMLVKKVYENTPAEKTGLRMSDTIVAINNQKITNQQHFFDALAISSGDAVVAVRRFGKFGEIKTRLALATFGTLGTYVSQGIQIDLVIPDSPASRAGLKQGDMILAMDNRKVLTQQAFDNAVNQSGGSVVLQVRRISGVGAVKVDVMNNSLGCWCEPAQGGMRVLSVGVPTLASRIGLGRGDIIYQVNNQPVNNLSTLQTLLENARGFLTVDIRSGTTGQLGRLNVTLN